MHYVYMFEFEAPNDFVAEQVLGELHESVLDISESDIENVKYSTQVLIRGRRISDDEKEHDDMREREANNFHFEGINHNPLPDDFPKVD